MNMIKNEKTIDESKKITRNVCFAYKEGHVALRYFDAHNRRNYIGGKSGYVIDLILKDMREKGLLDENNEEIIRD